MNEPADGHEAEASDGTRRLLAFARLSFATLMGPGGCHGYGTTSGGLPVVVRA